MAVISVLAMWQMIDIVGIIGDISIYSTDVDPTTQQYYK